MAFDLYEGVVEVVRKHYGAMDQLDDQVRNLLGKHYDKEITLTHRDFQRLVHAAARWFASGGTIGVADIPEVEREKPVPSPDAETFMEEIVDLMEQYAYINEERDALTGCGYKNAFCFDLLDTEQEKVLDQIEELFKECAGGAGSGLGEQE